jgi:tetratricopeptide (TPR) repeat protein
VCGQEVQLVPDFETIESKIAQSEKEKEEAERKREEERRFQEQLEQQKKKRMHKLVLMFVLIAAAVIIVTVSVVAAIRSRTVNTFDYQYAQAQECYENKDYTGALEHLKKALGYEPENDDANLLLAKTEYQLDQNDEAADVLEALLDRNGSLEEAYELLFQIYQDDSRPEKIQARLKKCSLTDILEKYSRFNPQPPVISPEGNTYNDTVKVEITADGTGEIRYTTDGTAPEKDSNLYTGKLELSQEGTITVQAILVTADGLVSDPAEAEYTISYDVPDAPVISPVSGTYKKMETEESGSYRSESVSSSSGEDTAQMITVKVPSGYTCYYSWDSKPDKSSKKYTGPVEMKLGDHVFYAVLCSKQGKLGKVASCTYIYTRVTPTPANTPTPTPVYTYTAPQNAEAVETPTPEPTETATPTPTETPTPTAAASESQSDKS